MKREGVILVDDGKDEAMTAILSGANGINGSGGGGGGGRSSSSSSSSSSGVSGDDIHAVDLRRRRRLEGLHSWLAGSLSSGNGSSSGQVEVVVVGSEAGLLLAVEELVTAIDPDIITGWDVERMSLGYLLTRAPHVPRETTLPKGAGGSSSSSDNRDEDEDEVDMVRRLSRVPDEARHLLHGNDDFLRLQQTDIHLTGRITLTLWRIMRCVGLSIDHHSFFNLFTRLFSFIRAHNNGGLQV